VTNQPTDDMPNDAAPSIQIDDDWKAEAEADREKQAQKEQVAQADGGPSAPGGPNALPPADFKGLVGVLASQAVMGLGAMPDPQGRGVMIDLDGAKFAIDLLAVIEEKTQGNLTDDESKELSGVVVELRSRFVQVTQLLAEQGGPAMPGAPPIAGGPPSASGGPAASSASKIIMPD
jgi:hypothetical protein